MIKKIVLLLLVALFFAACKKKPVETVSVPEQPPVQESPPAEVEEPEHVHPDHMVHKERDIPTPLIQLNGKLLDLSAACNSSTEICPVLLLYEDRLTLWDWQKNQGAFEYLFPPDTYGIRSRAPAGKIVKYDNRYVVLHNSLAQPLCFDEQMNPVQANIPPQLPLPVEGVNWFSLSDGKFYDFAFLEKRGLAAINMDYFLNVADSGNISVSDRRVGSKLALALPRVYTSSPTLPEEPDSIMKFMYENGAIRHVTNRLLDGQIMDLEITDLNQDRQEELLVVLRTGRGTFVEVLEPF